MLRYLIVFLLVMHGLAHVTGLVGAFGSGEQAFQDRPWIFSQDISARSPVGRACALLWLVALVGLVGAGLGLLFRQGWWPALAVAGAVISLVAIVPWLRVVPPGAWAGALFDLLIVVALLFPWADRIVEVLH